MKLIIFTFCLNIIFNIHFTSACKGCIEIGEFNFDKIIPRFEAVLVKFDVAYPFGEQHDIFAKVAEEIIDNKNFILAQLPMKDYGEKENEDFAKKYGVTKEDLPALRLFVQGEDEPFIFDKNLPWTEENVKKFVKEHTNIYLGLPGCLEAFDKLAAKFIAAKNRDKVLQETEKEAKKLTTEVIFQSLFHNATYITDSACYNKKMYIFSFKRSNLNNQRFNIKTIIVKYSQIFDSH